jgi:hypothetical protein
MASSGGHFRVLSYEVSQSQKNKTFTKAIVHSSDGLHWRPSSSTAVRSRRRRLHQFKKSKDTVHRTRQIPYLLRRLGRHLSLHMKFLNFLATNHGSSGTLTSLVCVTVRGPSPRPAQPARKTR